MTPCLQGLLRFIDAAVMATLPSLQSYVSSALPLRCSPTASASQASGVSTDALREQAHREFAAEPDRVFIRYAALAMRRAHALVAVMQQAHADQ